MHAASGNQSHVIFSFFPTKIGVSILSNDSLEMSVTAVKARFKTCIWLKKLRQEVVGGGGRGGFLP